MLCSGICVWSIPLSHDHLETETGLIHPLYTLGAFPSFATWNKSTFMKTSYEGKGSHVWNTNIIFKDSWVVFLYGLSDGSDGVSWFGWENNCCLLPGPSPPMGSGLGRLPDGPWTFRWSSSYNIKKPFPRPPSLTWVLLPQLIFPISCWHQSTPLIMERLRDR